MLLDNLSKTKSLCLIFLVSYLFIIGSTALHHAHDGDAAAGYDEHCFSCQWNHHTSDMPESDCQVRSSQPLAVNLPLPQNHYSNQLLLNRPREQSPPHTHLYILKII
jgi:hypothetical protein